MIKHLIIFSWLITSSLFSIANDFEKEKLVLVQNLFSCQSISYSIMNETDIQTKHQYSLLGYKYYNNAYSAYLKLQNPENDLDSETSEYISTIVQLYSKAFQDVNSLKNADMALGISFAKKILKRIAVDLLADKNNNSLTSSSGNDFISSINGRFILKDANCAGFEFIPNSKQVIWRNEFGCLNEYPLYILWLDGETFITKDIDKVNENCAPRISAYRIKSFQNNTLILTDIWTGWGEYSTSEMTLIKE